ncbi:hypothetical protein F5Y13DRAFT_206507 [Hypoxylon sp. FL1857]|nr:hypothetical protein F5Y13DRAFT_206507 [Hypoxylon sp. FL1857]
MSCQPRSSVEQVDPSGSKIASQTLQEMGIISSPNSDTSNDPTVGDSSMSVDTIVSTQPEIPAQPVEQGSENIEKEKVGTGEKEPANKVSLQEVAHFESYSIFHITAEGFAGFELSYPTDTLKKPSRKSPLPFYNSIKAKLGKACNSTFGHWQWSWEFINIVIATLAMIALVILLSEYNNTPLSPWALGITLNGVIAFLSAIWRLCMMSVVAECMGQLKWKWLDRPRKLLDLQMFDEAARGIPGSLKLLMRRYLTFAQIGAVFMVLSIAFDPFAQLLVDYPTKTIRVRDERVQMRRAVQYALVPPDEPSVRQDLHDNRLDHYLIQNIQAAMLLRSQKQFEKFYSSQQKCPSRNNCTWGVFTTLGVCSKCANLTSVMDTNCRHPTGESRNCSYNFPGIASFHIESNTDNMSAPWFISKEIPNNASDQLLGIGNPIIAVAMLRLPIFDLGNASSYHFYPPRNATACALYHCVQTCTGSTTNAQAVVEVHNQWTNTSMDASGETTDIRMTPSRENLHIPSHAEYNRTTYHVPARVARLIKEFFRSQLVGNITATAVKSPDNQTITDIHPALDTSVYLVNPLAFATFTYVGGQVSLLYDSISTAMTLYYRTLQENANYSVIGYTNNAVPVVQVRWYWISLPLLMYVLSLILAVLTLRFDQPLAPGWKNSSLAVLFHGLNKIERFSEVRTLAEMEKEAEGIEVRLQGNAEVLYLVES